MDTILNLLKDKNFHLQKFHQLNETELINFTDGNFDGLEIFYQARETILDLVRCIDRLVEAAVEAQGPDHPTSIKQKHEVIQAMQEKDDLVTRILAQDLQILSVIETAKSNIIKELRSVQSAKRAVGAYKSGDMNNKLDEKA